MYLPLCYSGPTVVVHWNPVIEISTGQLDLLRPPPLSCPLPGGLAGYLAVLQFQQASVTQCLITPTVPAPFINFVHRFITLKSRTIERYSAECSSARLRDYLPTTFAGLLPVLSIVPVTDGYPADYSCAPPSSPCPRLPKLHFDF